MKLVIGAQAEWIIGPRNEATPGGEKSLRARGMTVQSDVLGDHPPPDFALP